MIRVVTLVASSLGIAACSQAPADAPPVTTGAWTLDAEASELSFVSIKAGEIGEANRFEALSGSVTADGLATVEIDLASVDTGVDIRDERLRDILFVVADNPSAVVTARIDPAAFAPLAVGESVRTTLQGTLSLNGLEAPVEAQVTATRVSADRVMAVSDVPVILNAARFELVDGLAQLQELAGLPSITPVVPVTFSLSYER